MSMPKTSCPVSLERFTKTSKPILAKLGESAITVTPREFSTKSFGYFGNGKVTMMVDGVPVVFQAGITLTAVGSKEAPRREPAAPEVANK